MASGQNKKPDYVVYTEEDGYNAHLLPYATSVGAPAIHVEDVDLWKQRGVNKVNKQIQTKFNELKDEYQRLVEEYKWNELVYTAKFSFEPVIGEIYHLYEDKFGKYFLSLISPTEWNKKHIASVRLNSEHKWVLTRDM